MADSDAVERDYTTYKCLLELWSRENPIKTTKLQVLLAVNALLVSGVNLAGGILKTPWYVPLAGAVFSFIWMFSIGRTSLFQDVWQIKMADIRARHRDDPRFSILETAEAQGRARPLLRAFGAVSSKWYLLFSPLVFTLAWLALLVVTIVR